MNDIPNYITVDPDPLDGGQPGKVCYDFQGQPSHVTSVTLQITWNCDPTQHQTVTIQRSAGCVTIDVPKCPGVTITDDTGISADYQGTISLPPT